ncbi:hypothetical protein KSS87_000576 [Heliosperma pusillum]|nr:hypothetical protein KSS87_000576 [Heliosperma pusillum]
MLQLRFNKQYITLHSWPFGFMLPLMTMTSINIQYCICTKKYTQFLFL